MSEQVQNMNQQNKNQQNKKSGLGRGLGSLLGNESDHGAFAKITAPSPQKIERAQSQAQHQAQAQVVTPSQVEVNTPIIEPKIKEEFIEAPRVPENMRIWNIAIEKLVPNPKQPRQIFTKEALQELADSIKEKGVIQPLLVRKKIDGKFEIIAGERRWRASQLAGLTEVPALIKDSEDQEVLEIALIENIQRENLNPIEEAEAYDYLMTKYSLTQHDLALKVGKDRSTIANLLRLLNLHTDVRRMMSLGEISLGQAKVLLSLPDLSAQKDLAIRAKKENLSVRALEKLAAKPKNTEPAPLSDQEMLKNKLVQNLQEEMQKMLGSRVGIDYNKGQGKVSIHFYSDEELNQVVDRLRASWQN